MIAKAITTATVIAALTGSAVAADDFSILADIPVEALSQNEMAEIEGKYIGPWYNFQGDYGSARGAVAGANMLSQANLYNAFDVAYDKSFDLINSLYNYNNRYGGSYDNSWAPISQSYQLHGSVTDFLNRITF